ncbi:MAG TPA: ATP-binding protein, partial [Bacteroidota bacterium]
APVSIWQEDWKEVIRTLERLREEGQEDFAAYFREHPGFVTSMLNTVRILDVNEWTLGMFGAKDKAEMLASLETVFATPDTLPGFVGELIALAQGKTVYRTELALNTVKGELIHGLLAVSFPPRGSDSGNVIVSVIDISERKRAEDANISLNRTLETRASELEAVNKELEAFSYSVSHDLRAPLRSIDGFSAALLEDYTDKLDDQGRDYLRRVRGATQRMAELIDDMLEIARVTRSEMRIQTVDLTAMSESIALELKKSNPDRHAEFHIAKDISVEGDPHLLRIVMENLLGNAWKFTGKTGCPKIELGITDAEGKRAVFVRDNGVGFDMQYADKLFGVFQRLHTPAEFPGTGIGLATVQRIVHRHDGHVWAKATPGQGATFYFTLAKGREQ